MTRPKVFLFIPSLVKGGAERVISILSNNLAQMGYTTFLIFLNQSQHAYNLDPAVNVIYINNGIRKANLLKRISFIWNTFYRLLQIVRKEKPDVFISFITSANIWSGIIGNIFRIPYIVSERNTPDKTVNRLNPLMRKLVFQIYKNAKAVVAPSEGILVNLQKSESFSKLQNGIVINNPISVFENIDTSQLHPREFILAVGRLHPAKGFDRLINAYSELEYTNIDLIIAGAGNERENLENQIKELNLVDKVFLIGSQDNIQAYYKQCEIFVLSSRNEGYPNVLIEAMSAGCACVAVDCNYGPSEIISNGVNGVLVPNDDTHLLSKSIEDLLNNDELKMKISNEAMKIAEINSIEKIISIWDKLILKYA